MGSEARIIDTEENTFAAFALATTDSYLDKDGKWQDKQTLWNDIVVFNPNLIEIVKNFKTGTRLSIQGSLSYRPFDLKIAKNKMVTKKEASIVARQIELAPLVKKNRERNLVGST
jgi:single-stranded DNA-binding protein